MIHRFNEQGMKSLDPAWAGGRPRRITTTERELIVSSAKARPASLGQPFTRWSIRKLCRYLATRHKLVVSRERLRQILAEEEITFQATKTWKESPDPAKEEKLARIEEVLENHRGRTDAAWVWWRLGRLGARADAGPCPPAIVADRQRVWNEGVTGQGLSEPPACRSGGIAHRGRSDGRTGCSPRSGGSRGSGSRKPGTHRPCRLVWQPLAGWEIARCDWHASWPACKQPSRSVAGQTGRRTWCTMRSRPSTLS
ncbi:MAG: helix-turn-helix domain-containing protein [Acidimicrobiales bacterium]